MNVNIMGNRVLIKRIINEAKTEGGIIFSYTGEEKTDQATVVAVGPGRVTDEDVTIPLEVKVGDTIIYNTKSGVDVKIDGENYLMIKEEDIFLVVEE